MPEPLITSLSVPSAYWRRNVRLITVLLAAWAVLTFIPIVFARQLSFDFIGWPFAFWMAAYGGPVAYLVLIVVYACLMNKADAQQERDELQQER